MTRIKVDVLWGHRTGWCNASSRMILSSWKTGAGSLGGGDDMNGNGAERHYEDALQAQLGERVTNLGRRLAVLRTACGR